MTGNTLSTPSHEDYNIDHFHINTVKWMLWPSYLKIRLVYFNKTLLMKRKLCDFYAVEFYLFLTIHVAWPDKGYQVRLQYGLLVFSLSVLVYWSIYMIFCYCRSWSAVFCTDVSISCLFHRKVMWYSIIAGRVWGDLTVHHHLHWGGESEWGLPLVRQVGR